MIIDTPTSIVIAFSVIIAAFTTMHNVYMNSGAGPHKIRYYIAILIFVAISICTILILHYFDGTKHFINNAIDTSLVISETFIDGSTQFLASIQTFLANISFILLMLCEILPWLPLYFIIIRTSKRFHSITVPGTILFIFILPLVIIFSEFRFCQWIYELLDLNHAIAHLVWIEAISLTLHIHFVRFMIRK